METESVSNCEYMKELILYTNDMGWLEDRDRLLAVFRETWPDEVLPIFPKLRLATKEDDIIKDRWL